EESEGRAGVAQRATKQDFKAADRLAAPAAASSPEATPGLAAGLGSSYRDAEQDEIVMTENVRQVGQNTLYKRGNVICTSETAELFSSENGLKLDLDKLGDKVQVIERFTKDYFDLIAANSTEENRVLASQLEGEELLVKLRGQAYLIK